MEKTQVEKNIWRIGVCFKNLAKKKRIGREI